jgi:hypothetical protein
VNDLIAFLNARLDEDEAAATPGRQALDDLRFELRGGDVYEQHLSSRIEDGLDIQTAAWEARALREVEAKRRMLADLDLPHWGEAYLIALLASVYSDHPDYRQEWAPGT